MTVIPKNVTLDVSEGANNSYSYQWVKDNEPVNLENCIVEARFGNEMQCLAMLDNAANDGINIHAETGTIIINIEDDSTKANSIYESEYYEVKVTFGNGTVARPLHGAIRLHKLLVPEVTEQENLIDDLDEQTQEP